jgi:hypothetical protein
VSFEVVQEGPSNRGVKLRGHSKFLYDLYNAKNGAGYEQFINVIGPNGIGLIDKITFKEILTSSIDYSVRSGGDVKKIREKKILVVPQFKIGKNMLSPSQLLIRSILGSWLRKAPQKISCLGEEFIGPWMHVRRCRT